MGDKKLLTELLPSTTISILSKKVMKNREVIKDEVVYKEFEWEEKGVTYRVIPRHVPIEDVFKWAANSCKNCSSKGYYVLQMDKGKIKNPEDFIIMSDQNLEDMSEEQKKIMIQEESRKSYWRVLLPCKCALKRMQRKMPDVLSTDLGNILVKLDYEIK